MSSNLTDAKTYFEGLVSKHKAEIAILDLGRTKQITSDNAGGWVDTAPELRALYEATLKHYEDQLAYVNRELAAGKE
ncbi:hypothetical protein [Sinorhizobium sp. RAC02]|uniref:hypothetical protein n=1 Tax=Sinorhizobium sp. RAC02 TaxID=1842534 RepID=UPI00083CDDC2|nr:hypothetical protein [Sinorhizobium sp. RAC02]AOF90133.1 hypothetical protein BSY16_2284 [Sinorhizobium sp. RAC02]